MTCTFWPRRRVWYCSVSVHVERTVRVASCLVQEPDTADDLLARFDERGLETEPGPNLRGTAKTRNAATGMFDLRSPRHTSTLPIPAIAAVISRQPLWVDSGCSRCGPPYPRFGSTPGGGSPHERTSACCRWTPQTGHSASGQILSGGSAPSLVIQALSAVPRKRTMQLGTLLTGKGGNATFPIYPAGEVHPSKAVINGLRPRRYTYFNSAACRSTGRGISSSTRGYRSCEPRVTAWT
jgi:hypothetical protein